MDAGNVVVGRLDRIRWAMRRTGFYSPGSKGSLTDWTHSAILMTAGPATTPAEIDSACRAFTDAVAHLRAMSPLDW